MSLLFYLLFAKYSADLTSRFTTTPNAPTLRKFQDAVDQGYKVIVNKNGVARDMLKRGPKNSGSRNIFTNIVLKQEESTCLLYTSPSPRD